MSRPPAMTTTSYAILGLMAVKPWTTHQLVLQVDRSLRRMWARAQSKIFQEAHKLVGHGFAKNTEDSLGRGRTLRRRGGGGGRAPGREHSRSLAGRTALALPRRGPRTTTRMSAGRRRTLQTQRAGVDAEPVAGRRWPVGKDVAEVATAIAA